MATLFLDLEATQICQLPGVYVPSDQTQELAGTSSARHRVLRAPSRDSSPTTGMVSFASLSTPPTLLGGFLLFTRFALLIFIMWIAHGECELFETVNTLLFDLQSKHLAS